MIFFNFQTLIFICSIFSRLFIELTIVSEIKCTHVVQFLLTLQQNMNLWPIKNVIAHPCINIISTLKLETLDTGVLFLKSLRKRLMEKRCYFMSTPYHVTHNVEHLFLKCPKYDSVIPKLLSLISLQNITPWRGWKKTRGHPCPLLGLLSHLVQLAFRHHQHLWLNLFH